MSAYSPDNMSQERQLKRRREQTDDDHDIRAMRSDLWFDDGNVILQAGDVQFCVHRGVLCLHSEIFKDMFSLSQPDTSDAVDDCPVVHLSDKPEDVKHILTALYDRRYFRDKDAKQSFAKIVALLRLGSKYEISHLRDDALSRLSLDVPTSLQEYDTYLASGMRAMEDCPALRHDLFNLAMEQRLSSMLPTLFVFCVEANDFDYEQFKKGIQREDGSIAVLSPDDQEKCIIGRQKLLKMQASLFWTETSAQNCWYRDACTLSRLRVAHGVWYPPGKIVGIRTWSTEWEKGICPSCVERGRRLHQACRATLWDALPSFFGLPDWKTLKNNKPL